jgi:hypothetical protein
LIARHGSALAARRKARKYRHLDVMETTGLYGGARKVMTV